MGLRTAAELAAKVRSGELGPVEVVSAALSRIEQARAELGAFVTVRREAALAEAWELAARPDLAELPLAGVPVTIKDNIEVAGEPSRFGSLASSDAPAAADHELVRRLRAAGAVVVALTTLPELGLWPFTDAPGQTTRNPWDLSRSPGGSSGGAAASVAAGLVPIAHGNDGGGSLRIPAANCGLFTIKPGSSLTTPPGKKAGWGGLVADGAFTTTVADGALALSVLADRPELASPVEPRELKIGVDLRSASPLAPVDPAWKQAVSATAAALVKLGHQVTTARLAYPANPWVPLSRWFGGAAEDAQRYDWSQLQPRTRTHVRIGKTVNRFGLVSGSEKLRSGMERAFEGFDVVITPTLARNSPQADGWSQRPWAQNWWASVRYAPYCIYWNILDWPAASVPSGLHPRTKTPLATQLIARPGQEELLLGLAAQLERLRPWPRVAPAFDQ
jgi:amidase